MKTQVVELYLGALALRSAFGLALGGRRLWDLGLRVKGCVRAWLDVVADFGMRFEHSSQYDD